MQWILRLGEVVGISVILAVVHLPVTNGQCASITNNIVGQLKEPKAFPRFVVGH